MMELRVGTVGEIKAVDAEKGIIAGYPVSWKEDRAGDVFLPGSYKDSLADYMRTGGPVFFNHSFSDMPIGKTLDIGEDSKGVYAVAQLRAPGQSAQADEVRACILDGSIRGLSHSFAVQEWEPRDGRRDPQGLRGREIRRSVLYEWGPVTLPCNPHAVITDVKSLKSLAAHFAADSPQARALAGDDATPEVPEEFKALVRVIWAEQNLKAFGGKLKEPLFTFDKQTTGAASFGLTHVGMPNININPSEKLMRSPRRVKTLECLMAHEITHQYMQARGLEDAPDANGHGLLFQSFGNTVAKACGLPPMPDWMQAHPEDHWQKAARWPQAFLGRD